MGSGNWIVDNLNSALEMWNERLSEIWQLITTSPESFKGGGIWAVIVNINDGLKAVGYALLVLFFVMGIVKTCGSFAEMKKPELAFKCFIRFVLAQAAVTWGMELMTGAFRVAQGHGDNDHRLGWPDGHVGNSAAGRDGRHHRGCGLYRFYPLMGGDAAGLPFYLGSVPRDDPDGV